MKNTDVYNLVEERKNELKKVWYDTSDENIDFLINGFIKIANSMLVKDIEKISNFELNKIFAEKILYIKKYISLYEDSWILYQDEIINDYITKWSDLLFKHLTRKEKQWIISTKEIKEITKIIKKSKGIMNKYNKWQLDSKQEKILIELWYQYNLK